MKVALSDLGAQVAAGVEKLGYQGNDAAVIVEVLLYAQLRGNNQGIAKLATGGVPPAHQVQPLCVVKETAVSALFSGGNAMVATAQAADKAVELARQQGVAVVCSHRVHTSSGAIGYYVRRVAEQGLIGLIFVGTGDWAAVAPAGSAQARLGTNPLAYAFPYEGGVVVFDTATSAMAYYAVVEAMLKGEALPPGVAVNAQGEFTTNPAEVLGTGGNEAMAGALVTFAGHKGFGLSLLVQVLGGAFALAGFPGHYSGDDAGTCIIALDPGLFAGRQEYLTRSREFVDSVTAAPPIAGQQVLLPGQRGDALAAQAQHSGEVDVDEAVWSQLLSFVGEQTQPA